MIAVDFDVVVRCASASVRIGDCNSHAHKHHSRCVCAKQFEQKKFLQQHKVRADSYSKAAATMKKQRKKKNTAANADKEIKVNTGEHHSILPSNERKGKLENVRGLECIPWVIGDAFFYKNSAFSFAFAVRFVGLVVVGSNYFNYTSSEHFVKILEQLSFHIQPPPIACEWKQSIQAMDEEKNKLDAFCEQSLKNVSRIFQFKSNWVFCFCFKLLPARSGVSATYPLIWNTMKRWPSSRRRAAKWIKRNQ